MEAALIGGEKRNEMKEMKKMKGNEMSMMNRIRSYIAVIKRNLMSAQAKRTWLFLDDEWIL